MAFGQMKGKSDLAVWEFVVRSLVVIEENSVVRQKQVEGVKGACAQEQPKWLVNQQLSG